MLRYADDSDSPCDGKAAAPSSPAWCGGFSPRAWSGCVAPSFPSWPKDGGRVGFALDLVISPNAGRPYCVGASVGHLVKMILSLDMVPPLQVVYGM